LDIREGLTFDDVLLVPKFSDVSSRSQTDLSTQLSRNISINIPLISANMDTVTESSMAVTIAREGGIGIIHRFLSIKEDITDSAILGRSSAEAGHMITSASCIAFTALTVSKSGSPGPTPIPIN